MPRFNALLFTVAITSLSSGFVDSGHWARAGETLTFERDVRPILKTHCFHCHGEGDELAGGLDVRLRRLLVQGGDSGAALTPGDVEASELIRRMRDGEMPPEDVTIRPKSDEVERIAAWVAAGAPTARPEPEQIDGGLLITEEERQFWSFQPIRDVAPPAVEHTDRLQTPVDAFLLARLEKESAEFATAAEPTVLARRAYLDLLGLPPSPDEVAEFVADCERDDTPRAFARLVDRLLASPRYGERWGRHWLDVAGYADSEGYNDADAERPDAYKYRDYVIRAFNDDKPFDQFIREQLAGDEMVRPPYAELSPEDIEKLTATGFLRMAPDGTASTPEPNVARNQTIADTIQIVSTSLLGLTVGCAQCHHHRYDPIPQDDYYRLRAVFDPALNWRSWLAPNARRVSLYREADRQAAAEIEQQAKEIEARRTAKQTEHIDRVFEQELAKLSEELREPIRTARGTPEKERTAEQTKLLKEHPSVNVSAGSLYLLDKKAADELKALADEAAKVRATKPKESFIRALTEPLDKAPPVSQLFYRGDHEQPKQEVMPAALTVLADHQPPEIPTDDPELPTTGRRLAYARWLTSGRHPLVARVIVNRIWLHHFGRGLVETPGDFGRLGVPPTHPELLDWLANRFVQEGWSVKRLHRVILLSAAYQQSSTGDPSLAARDPDNRLLGRQNVRRLDAEAFRDAVLSVSGQLNAEAFGPPVPVMADRVGQFVIGIDNLNAGRPGEVLPMHGQEFRRSVFVQVRRSRPLSVLDTFDAPRMDPNCTARASSTVSPQSLLLMNSDFLLMHASRLAERVQSEAGEELAARIERAWVLVCGRRPTAEEAEEARAFVAEQTAHFEAHPVKDQQPGQLALASLCHALLSSNEFMYVE
ncbi:MAG: DUF1553 domain-containing protein [Planctomycetales bacterium]|nr:DUF1553 domain-containing protein [Planctomycetales bacterium]